MGISGNGSAASPALEHFDVLIVGAGLSGIGAAHQLQEECPDKTYAILESRETLGGTWDIFRYPGIRSDSDMYTLGYRFRPWTSDQSLADGPAILEYIRDTADEAGIDRKIRYRHRVVRCEWSTPDARWTITCERTDTGETVQLTCGFLYNCGGYYRYDEGYTPEFKGIERFAGTVVHPQVWPEDLDCTGRRVVVIGSGATAITIVPALAGVAEHVTMLQRSPTYIISVPARDPIARFTRRLFPERASYVVNRWKNVGLQIFLFQASQRWPSIVKRALLKLVRHQLPTDFDVERHLTPRYNPWDQRLCAVPDGDLFKAIRAGHVSIVTDTIDTFTETGVKLTSGDQLEADVVITATGFNLQLMGGVEMSVDGEPVQLSERMAYKGLMLSDIPNHAFTVGYTNASWTLKADLVAEYVCRLLKHMDEHGYDVCVPTNDDASIELAPLLDFGAGYVARASGEMPQQGSRTPWRLRMNYAYDVIAIRRGQIDDGVIRFSRKQPAVTDAPDLALAG